MYSQFHSPLPFRNHRLDVAAASDSGSCIKFSHEMRVCALKTCWSFGLVDCGTGAGFDLLVCTQADAITMSDGSHTFLALTGLTMPKKLTLVLDVKRSGNTFLASVELVGESPRVCLPKQTMPETTHLCAEVRLPEEPQLDLESWNVSTSQFSNAEAVSLPTDLRQCISHA